MRGQRPDTVSLRSHLENFQTSRSIAFKLNTPLAHALKQDKRLELKLNANRTVSGVLRGFDPFM